ncbi:DUF4282 domain-containing protein [Parvularcula marina]|uniref:DUF4282 domain-containing protein n=1 Tax=Parvularcula marina TaxID=2292771 RepID=UPI003515A9D7
MSDLIGRFLSFDEHLGRGLVKFAYFVSLFYIVVIHLFHLVGHLIHLDIGEFLLVPFKFLLWVLVLRILAEFLMAVLSIDDHLQTAGGMQDGFEAGLTPEPGAQPDSPKSAAPIITPAPEAEASEDQPSTDDDGDASKDETSPPGA